MEKKDINRENTKNKTREREGKSGEKERVIDGRKGLNLEKMEGEGIEKRQRSETLMEARGREKGNETQM